MTRLPLAAALFVLALLFGALALYLARFRVELVPARPYWWDPFTEPFGDA